MRIPGRGVSRRRHRSKRAMNEKLAKSGDTRCPAQQGAEGQSRTKQFGVSQMGVRNEHGPTAKAMMCSELDRNVERAAEMTAPLSLGESSNKIGTRSHVFPLHFP